MIERIRVDLDRRGYDVVVGDGAIDELARVLDGRRRVAIVSQERIPSVHLDRVAGALEQAGVEQHTFFMGDGEEAQVARDGRRTVPRLRRVGAAAQ